MLDDNIQFDRKIGWNVVMESLTVHRIVYMYVHVHTQLHTHLHPCINPFPQNLINQVVHLTITALST